MKLKSRIHSSYQQSTFYRKAEKKNKGLGFIIIRVSTFEGKSELLEVRMTDLTTVQ